MGAADRNEAFFQYSDIFTPESIYRLEPAGNRARALSQAVELHSMPARYVTEQVFYTSKDGTQRADVHHASARSEARRQNRGAAVWLRRLRARRIAALSAAHGGLARDRRCLCAGESARRIGIRRGVARRRDTSSKKQNVFDDFIAAAEWLIAKRYTTRDAACDPRPQQRGTSGGRRAQPAAGTVCARRCPRSA